MTNARTVTTKASVWTFDFATMRYIRTSRTGEEHPNITYVAEWQPFTAVDRHNDRLFISGPDLWSGTIETDSADG